MLGFQRINRTLPVMLLVAVMSLAASCSNINVTPDISISENVVSSESGYVFVDVTAAGQWVLSIYYDGSDEGWADLTSSEGSGSKDGVILRYEENTSAESRSLQVILTASGQDVAVTFTQSGKDPSGGDDPDPDPGFSENPGWLELPALAETEDCHFYWHDMTSGGKTVRNYSFLWDRENLVAHWVAYPLNTGLIGTGSRTDNWGYDPLVPRDEQPELYRGYNGDYDRGHQLPSADRLTRNANIATFYFTNMTPQIGSRFNQSIWGNFETKVRDWSRTADTLYVVTGCVLEGSPGVAYDNLDKAVTVPGGYFKALLWYNHASTYSFGQYTAAGFFMDHRNYSGNTFVPDDYIMSIDDLEEITGIDFFVNLPAKIGQSQADVIESSDPSGVSLWN